MYLSIYPSIYLSIKELFVFLQQERFREICSSHLLHNISKQICRIYLVLYKEICVIPGFYALFSRLGDFPRILLCLSEVNILFSLPLYLLPFTLSLYASPFHSLSLCLSLSLFLSISFSPLSLSISFSYLSLPLYISPSTFLSLSLLLSLLSLSFSLAYLMDVFFLVE